MRMRKSQLRSVNYNIVDRHYVDIDQSVAVAAIRIAMWGRGERFFNPLEDMQNFKRGLIGYEEHPDVEEFIWRDITPGIRLNMMGQFEPSEFFLYCTHSL